ncbi:MAG: hypothetical protein ACYC0H_21650, partial [Solirubrobacteraceae bacterium]
VARLEQRDKEVLTNRLLDPQLVEEILLAWPDLPDGDINYDSGAFEIPPESCQDLEAGLELAEDWLERQVSLWRLQGGDVAVVDHAFAYDLTAGTVHRLRRPRPLKLLPDNLQILNDVLGGPAAARSDQGWRSSLPDAIVQLAQARSSSRGAALADLWTVAEAVFAGSAAEKSVGAAAVMAEVAQVRYPEELLMWFSSRFDELGLSCGQRPPTEKPEDWALAVFEAHGPELFHAVESDPRHAVLYVRCKAFSAWSRSSQMEKDLAELGRRMQRVAERAYLVRNFFVHSAQPYRATALRVTLPVFAELMRVCLGFLTTDNRRIDDPIQAAKLAAMRVAWLAERYADEKPRDAGPLRAYLNS